MKNHVIVLTIDLDAIAKKAMAVMGFISLPFLWIYYTIYDLVDDIVFYAPFAWKAVKRYTKAVIRYACPVIRYAKHTLILTLDKTLYSGMYILFLVYHVHRKTSSWFADAWAFRAAVLAEC